MKEETRRLRHEVIKNAAYSLLAEKGYDGASMLSIARAAKASNETLYRWYGNKRGLFERLVRDNAADIAEMLNKAIDQQDDPIETLQKVAPVFLTMLLGDRAVLLNKAAAAEPTGELGTAVLTGGRNAIQPLFGKLMQNLAAEHTSQTADNEPHFDAGQLTGWFLSLLVGDLQIRRVIGVAPVPTKTEIENRTTMALQALSRLMAQPCPIEEAIRQSERESG